MLREIFADPWTAEYWNGIFDAMYEKRTPSIWDYQWLYTRLINNSVTAVPRVNLVENIGFGPDSTHTHDPDPRLIVPRGAMTFPLTHPLRLVPLQSMDRKLQTLYSIPINQRIVRKVTRVARRIFRTS
jgi:hypothetical protein